MSLAMIDEGRTTPVPAERYQAHHAKLVESHHAQMAALEAEMTREGRQRKCSRCWLRSYECYCSRIVSRSDEYLSTTCEVEVVMYYSFKEMGRGTNTAHLLEQLLPGVVSKVIQGDQDAEKQLINEIAAEFQSRQVRTCIMWPTPEAKVISQWQLELASPQEGIGQSPESASMQTHTEGVARKGKIRLLALDGTYPCAKRLFKHLKVNLDALGVPIPLVKLDLGDEGCRSAYFGVQNQPTKDKICTYQAVVLAMQQLGESETMCENLLRDLDEYISYILQRKIKLGKEKTTTAGYTVACC